MLGPVIGPPTASAAMRTVLVDFSGLAMAEPLERSWLLIVSSALALAIIASIDALLCAKLASRPGELRAGDDRLLVRLGLSNAIAAAFGGITSGINIGPSLTNRAFGGQSPLSVLVNAAAVLAAATLLFPVLAYIPRAVLSAAVMVVAIQHIDPWTGQLVRRLVRSGTPQRGAIALDLGVCLFVSLLSIAVNVVLAVFIGIALAVLLFVVRMSRSNIRKLYRCDAVRSRRYRDPAELEVLHAKGVSVLVVELQGALFFGSAERLAQIVERESARGHGCRVARNAADHRDRFDGRPHPRRHRRRARGQRHQARACPVHAHRDGGAPGRYFPRARPLLPGYRSRNRMGRRRPAPADRDRRLRRNCRSSAFRSSATSRWIR